jgi:hypothetical protein
MRGCEVNKEKKSMLSAQLVTFMHGDARGNRGSLELRHARQEKSISGTRHQSFYKNTKMKSEMRQAGVILLKLMVSSIKDHHTVFAM